MNGVQLAHVAHVFGAVGLFAAMGIEAAALRREQDAALLRLSRQIGLPSMLALLAAGVFLAGRLWTWSGPWFQAAIPGLVAVVVAGAALRRAPWISFWLRAGLLAAILYLMAAKPDVSGSITTLVTGALLGAAVGVLGAGRSARRGLR